MTASARLGPSFHVCLIAGLLRGRRHIAVGANSPIPASAALLARALSGGRTIISILGSRRHNAFTGLNDLFDSASVGRMDAFFLSPGQIDGQANINMVGVGEYPSFDVRWSGSHGSPLLYMMIPNIILFREEHSRRVLVPQVDFVSAPGVSPSNVYRPGGPTHLVTGRALLSFERETARFQLMSLHPGQRLDDIVEHTGFEFDRPLSTPTTAIPDPAMLRVLADKVSSEVAEIYPQFAGTLRNDAEVCMQQASHPGLTSGSVPTKGDEPAPDGDSVVTRST